MHSAVQPTHSTLFKRLQRVVECSRSDPSIAALIGRLRAFLRPASKSHTLLLTKTKANNKKLWFRWGGRVTA